MTDLPAPEDEFDADEAQQFDDDGASYVDSGIEDTAWEALQDWQAAATYDVLYLADVLGRQNPPGRMEFHTFAYLACLMSVFRGRPASDWGYAFSAVPPTLPFSPAIEGALSDLVASGHLERVPEDDDEGASPEYVLTAEGRDDLGFLCVLQSFEPRNEFLRASGKTAIFSSLPAVVNSVSYEPQLAQALKLDNPRLLLTQVSSGPLYREFDALLRALGTEHRELIVPASLYVRYLQQRARQDLEDALVREEGE